MSRIRESIKQPIKRVATINDEALGEDTDPNYELKYIDIGNVDSSGKIHEIATYRFENAPSRARRIVRDGDVIISTVRTYLQAIAPIESPPDNLIVSTGFAVVRPSLMELDTNYCKYAVREPSFLHEVVTRSVGVSYPAINASELGNIPIFVPPLPEQRAIADYLDRETAKLDTLIAAKERLLDRLAEKRRALITHAVTRGLNPNTTMRDSGVEWLGKIPEHWKVIHLRYLTNEPLAYGANEPGLEDDPRFPRFVRITDIDENGLLREDTFKSLPPEIAEPYLLQEGDVLLARSGATVGKAFIYRKEWGDACFAGYLIRFRCNRKLLQSNFFFLFTQTETYWSQVREGTIQATIQNFSAEKYANILVPLPPVNEQQTIIKFLTNKLAKMNELSQATQHTIELLHEHRAALIAAAVSGQIRVAG